MAYDLNTPYDELPLLPPEVEINTKDVLIQCINASRELGELKGAGTMLPDQSILINAIPLQEAKLSSEIENIVTTQDELFFGDLDINAITDPNVKEVFRYRTALRHGYEVLGQGTLNAALIEEVCSVLRAENVRFRTDKSPTVRIVQNYSRKVIYTPPRGGKNLQKKMSNLLDFLNKNDEFDPLIRLAIAHYQFEAIHPFSDGNGRTGRILNILFLIQSNLINIPVLYLSRYITQNKPNYYRLLRRVTENGEWEAWVLYMLKGIEETAHWTTNRIHAIYDLLGETIEKCRVELPRIYSKELVELIFRQPYCKIQFLVEAGIAERQTASNYLQELEKIGVLKGEKRGRQMIYKNPALIEVLTA
jgi:Fic family protein